jgi:hypothetical protein
MAHGAPTLGVAASFPLLAEAERPASAIYLLARTLHAEY